MALSVFIVRLHLSLTHSIQTFSVPGSMYLCILAGALWGVPVALPIVCISIATGASFCYMLSKHVGDCIRVMPRWQQRVDTWKATVQQYEGNLLSYLTILRMMPVPPHFVVNIIAPHLGVPLSTFWLSTLCGVFCTSLIYTAIGKEIGQITSSDSFHIFTWQNMLLMTVVAMAFILPTLVKGRVQAPEQSPAHQGNIRLTEDARGCTWRDRMLQLYQSLLALIHPALHARPVSVPRDSSLGASLDSDETEESIGA